MILQVVNYLLLLFHDFDSNSSHLMYSNLEIYFCLSHFPLSQHDRVNQLPVV
jgi:hypothetical protein